MEAQIIKHIPSTASEEKTKDPKRKVVDKLFYFFESREQGLIICKSEIRVRPIRGAMKSSEEQQSPAFLKVFLC